MHDKRKQPDTSAEMEIDMSEKTKVEVKIQGRLHTIVADESEEYIYRISSYVDKKMSEISSRNSRLSMDMTATLTAINLADELFKSKQTEDNLRRQLLQYAEDARKAEEQIKMLKFEITELRNKIEKRR